MPGFAKPVFPYVVDNSIRKELAKCQMIAHWKFELGLVPLEPNVDTHAGGAFAAGLEAARLSYYRDGKSEADAINIGINAVLRTYGSFVSPKPTNKSAARMAGALVFYFTKFPMSEDDYEPVHIGDKWGIEVAGTYELPIRHPVDGKVLVQSYRFDILARKRSDGTYWVRDEKTTSQLGDSWAFQWDLDSQMTSYCHAANLMLSELGIEDSVQGAVINGISILKNDYGHMEVPTLRQPWEIERWYRQMIRDIEEWKSAFVNQNHRQVLDHACALYNRPCEYNRLCKSNEPHKLVDSYQIHFWNPITRE